MKKTMKRITLAILTCVLCCMSIVPAFADNGQITPRWTNTSNTTMSFVVDDGQANFYVSYVANTSTFSQAQLRVQIQKRVLGLFWRNVGDEWVGYSTALRGDFYDYIPVDGKGTYRANFTLTVYGTQGATDVIEDTIEVKYS